MEMERMVMVVSLKVAKKNEIDMIDGDRRTWEE